MTKAQAMRMMTTCIKRKEFNKATYSQVAKMQAVGIDGFDLSYKQACDVCWEIQQAHGRRPSDVVLANIVGRKE